MLSHVRQLAVVCRACLSVRAAERNFNHAQISTASVGLKAAERCRKNRAPVSERCGPETQQLRIDNDHVPEPEIDNGREQSERCRHQRLVAPMHTMAAKTSLCGMSGVVWLGGPTNCRTSWKSKCVCGVACRVRPGWRRRGRQGAEARDRMTTKEQKKRTANRAESERWSREEPKPIEKALACNAEIRREGKEVKGGQNKPGAIGAKNRSATKGERIV